MHFPISYWVSRETVVLLLSSIPFSWLLRKLRKIAQRNNFESYLLSLFLSLLGFQLKLWFITFGSFTLCLAAEKNEEIA